ncbi:hypothetical protein QJS04_geneDACA022580 [Acorus gramineus]|uniref:Uncharacterized protein n=1 Tax=Acorus gramineus TaxID=55184 RepID=A0AAV8ZXR2_ACOGR|nr:hypothetical protein QJS04_geneDACA022580 [Acorus gramineus]
MIFEQLIIITMCSYNIAVKDVGLKKTFKKLDRDANIQDFLGTMYGLNFSSFITHT